MRSLKFSFVSVFLSILFAVAPIFTVPALAYDDNLITKETFEMDSYTTVGGKTISNVKIGWESYGTRKDQSGRDKEVILITPHFSAYSHAAGKYASDATRAPATGTPSSVLAWP